MSACTCSISHLLQNRQGIHRPEQCVLQSARNFDFTPLVASVLSSFHDCLVQYLNIYCWRWAGPQQICIILLPFGRMAWITQLFILPESNVIQRYHWGTFRGTSTSAFFLLAVGYEDSGYHSILTGTVLEIKVVGRPHSLSEAMFEMGMHTSSTNSQRFYCLNPAQKHSESHPQLWGWGLCGDAAPSLVWRCYFLNIDPLCLLEMAPSREGR